MESRMLEMSHKNKIDLKLRKERKRRTTKKNIKLTMIHTMLVINMKPNTKLNRLRDKNMTTRKRKV